MKRQRDSEIVGQIHIRERRRWDREMSTSCLSTLFNCCDRTGGRTDWRINQVMCRGGMVRSIDTNQKNIQMTTRNHFTNKW